MSDTCYPTGEGAVNLSKEKLLCSFATLNGILAAVNLAA